MLVPSTSQLPMTHMYRPAYVFVLLFHFVSNGDITGHVMMISPIRGRTVTVINESVVKNRAIMCDLMAAHGLTRMFITD